MIELGNTVLEPATNERGIPVVKEFKRWVKGGRYFRPGELQHVTTYHFKDDLKRAEWLWSREAAWQSRLAQRQVERAKRSLPHSFRVGDIVYSSWGYEQTNIDFYVVTRCTGHYVWLRGLKATTDETGQMSGSCRPVMPLEPVGDEVKHGASSSGYIHLTSYSSASMWDGQPKHCSWYA